MADLLAAVFVICGLGVYGYEIDDAPHFCYWITGLAVVGRNYVVNQYFLMLPRILIIYVMVETT